MSQAYLKVLLAEEDAVDVGQAERMLRENELKQLDICRVATLNKCIEQLEQSHFHVVILDLSLPDSQGLETFGQVHEMAPHIPIVILTGLADESLGIRAVREGAQDYLVKGEFDARVLDRSIGYAIERKRAEVVLREADRLRVLVEIAEATAHEINQPLQGIVGHVDLMRLKIERGGDLKEDLDVILEGCNRISEIVNQMGDIKQYTTKPYLFGHKIIDIGLSAGKDIKR